MAKVHDFETLYPDIDEENLNGAPDWLVNINIDDEGIVQLTAEQKEIAERGAPSDDAGIMWQVQKTYSEGGLRDLRAFLHIKSQFDLEHDKSVKLSASDDSMARIAEDLLVYLKGKFPEDDFTAVIGVKGMEKVNARRKVRGDTPL